MLCSQNKKPICKINISVPLAPPNAMAKMSSHVLSKWVVSQKPNPNIIGCAEVWGFLCQCCFERSMLHDSRLTQIKVLKGFYSLIP